MNYLLTIDEAITHPEHWECLCYVRGSDEPGYILKEIAYTEFREHIGEYIEDVPFWQWIQNISHLELCAELELYLNRKENRTTNYLLSQPHLMDLGVDGLRRVA